MEQQPIPIKKAVSNNKQPSLISLTCKIQKSKTKKTKKKKIDTHTLPTYFLEKVETDRANCSSVCREILNYQNVLMW